MMRTVVNNTERTTMVHEVPYTGLRQTTAWKCLCDSLMMVRIRYSASETWWHAQKPDFVFRRNGRVHLNRRWRQFSRLLAAEVCASALLMLDTPCSEVVWEYWLPTPFASFPFTSPFVRHRVPSGFKSTLPKQEAVLKWTVVFGRNTWLFTDTVTQQDGNHQAGAYPWQNKGSYRQEQTCLLTALVGSGLLWFRQLSPILHWII